MIAVSTVNLLVPEHVGGGAVRVADLVSAVAAPNELRVDPQELQVVPLHKIILFH